MQQKTFPIYLETSYMLTPRVKHFVFNCNLDIPFSYIPGQFITINFMVNEKILRRSYSIANQPQNNNRIEFAAGYVENGPATQLLFNLKEKDTLNISGPYGKLVLKDILPKRYILVATSTGITPYRAMLTELEKRLLANPELKIIILQGVRKKEDILYKDEFLNFMHQHPQVDFRMHFSQETEFNQNEYSGYVQSAFPALNPNPTEDLVYLCGNPSMIDNSYAYLTNLGFTGQQIIREKYFSKPQT